jgi:hypothetical protein
MSLNWLPSLGAIDMKDVAVWILEPRSPEVSKDMDITVPARARQVIMLKLDPHLLQGADDRFQLLADAPGDCSR